MARQRGVCDHCRGKSEPGWSLCMTCYYTVPNLWNSEECKDPFGECSHRRIPTDAEVEAHRKVRERELARWL